MSPPTHPPNNRPSDLIAGVTTGIAHTQGQENIFVATTTIGAASCAAYAEAQRWLEETRP